MYIFWLRQLKRYFRSRSRIVGSLGQPLLFLIALGFGFGPIFSAAGGGDYMQFLTPGIIAMSVLFMAMFSGIEVIWDRQFGFLKETLVAPVPRFKIMLGRTLGGATVATMQGLIVLFLSSAFLGFVPVSLAMVPVAVFFMFFTAILFTAMGTAIASLMDDMHGFQLVMNFLIMPVFFLSGALFPLSGLPEPLVLVSSLDPLSYGVDGLRGSLAGISHFGLFMDAGVLFALSMIFMAIGSYFFSRVQA